MSEVPFRSGFVSIVGRPNAGKSTLLNALIGTKVAIVASKPQTTRTVVQGVLTTKEAQVVFLDTPGIHKSDTLFNKRMMHEVRSALDERDLLLYVVDATKRLTSDDEKALDLVRKAETRTFAVLNKVDAVPDKRNLLPLIEQYKAAFDFAEYIPIAARTGDGVERLTREIIRVLPEGPLYFPSDQITDQPERFLAAELIREKILEVTRQEVPHSVAVLVDSWVEEKRLIRISATIIVERPGQKAILIGAGGGALKEIGSAARLEIEAMVGKKVFLELFVKVRENWRESPEFLNELDWRTMAGGTSTT